MIRKITPIGTKVRKWALHEKTMPAFMSRKLFYMERVDVLGWLARKALFSERSDRERFSDNAVAHVCQRLHVK